MVVVLYINSHYWFANSNNTEKKTNNLHNTLLHANKTHIPWQILHGYEVYY